VARIFYVLYIPSLQINNAINKTFDAKTVLLDQLLANANDRSWYISFYEAVAGLSEAEAFWKPDDSRPSGAAKNCFRRSKSLNYLEGKL